MHNLLAGIDGGGWLMARRTSRPSGIGLFGVLLVTVLSFGTGTLVSELSTRREQVRSDAIARNAVPSIEHLTTLRTELFRIELLTERELHADAPTRAVLQAELQRARDAAQSEFQADLATPYFPGEAATTELLRTQLVELDEDLTAFRSGQGPDAARVAEQVAPAVQRAGATVFALIRLNADQAEELSRENEAARRRSVRLAWVLDSASAVLAAMLAMLAWRAVRFYLDTQEVQQRLLGARAEELEAFAGRVAHDILNPLNAVHLSLAAMERGAPQAEVVPRAQASVRRVQRIIEALLGFARAGARPEPGSRCEVQPVLAGVVADQQEVAREHGIELTLEPVQPGLAVACLPGVLASVTGNLVANAIKYLSPDRPERRVTVRVRERGRMVAVEVADTGPGIPPALQQTIFEPYVRGHTAGQPGIGLGLATAKKLCESHGGRVGLDSQPGRGSTFWFELPTS